MIDCINREVFEDIGKICSDAQIEMAIRHFGPGMEKDYELRFSLTQCKQFKIYDFFSDLYRICKIP